MSEVDAWMKFFQTFGFAAGLLLLMLFGMYRLGRYYVEQVAKPQADRAIVSLDHTDLAVGEQTAVLREVNANLREVHRKIDEIHVIIVRKA